MPCLWLWFLPKEAESQRKYVTFIISMEFFFKNTNVIISIASIVPIFKILNGKGKQAMKGL